MSVIVAESIRDGGHVLVPFSEHWLTEWLREYEIASIKQYDRALESGSAVKDLHDRARRESWKRTYDRPVNGTGFEVLASRKFDLSGLHECTCRDCVEWQLKDTLVRSLPYFDRVVYDGPSAGHFSSVLGMPRSRNRDEDLHSAEMRKLRGLVAQFIRLQQDPSLVDAISFAPKPSYFCPKCESEHAAKYHVPHEDDELNDLRQRLADAQVKVIRNKRGGWRVYVLHPLLDGAFVRTYDRGARPSKSEIVNGVAYSMVQPAIADLAAADRHKLPLLDGYNVGTTEDQDEAVDAVRVALNLPLPVLRDVDLTTFANVRQEYEPSFKRFQSAVRTAIEEQAKKVAADGDAGAQAAAQAVVREYVEPEIAGIRQGLDAALGGFVRKLSLSGVVGTAITTVGFVGSVPVGITTGIAAAMTGLVQAHKYLDDRSEVEKHDLHFLWELEKRSKHSR